MSGRIKELVSKKERGGILNEMKFATTNNRSEKICVKAWDWLVHAKGCFEVLKIEFSFM